MKKLILLSLLAISIHFVAKAGEGINFIEGTYKDALAKAGEENKLLFLDCFTTWCGPCKQMAAHVFTEESVSNYFNKTFVCMKLDMEKGEGVEIAKKYTVKNYPTYLWIDAGGKQVHRSVGSTSAELFLKIANNAVSADRNLSYLEEQYKSGNKKPAVLLAYAHALSDAYNMTYMTVADEYFRSQPVADLSNETNWKNILELTPNMNSYVFNTISINPEPFYKRYGKDSVDLVLDNLVLMSLHYATQQHDSVLLAKAVARLKQCQNSDIRKDAAREELNYYKRNDKMDKYTALAPGYVATILWNDAVALNDVCWTYFMKVEDKAKLADAEKWIAQSVKLEENYYNTDTYANILHKEGKNKEAIDMSNHSIALAKQSGLDYSATRELLDTIGKESGTAKGK